MLQLGGDKTLQDVGERSDNCPGDWVSGCSSEPQPARPTYTAPLQAGGLKPAPLTASVVVQTGAELQLLQILKLLLSLGFSQKSSAAVPVHSPRRGAITRAVQR